MNSNQTSIDKPLLKLINEFSKDFRGLNQEKKLILSEFLSQESEGIVSKELMLKCLQAPSQVTPEELAKIVEYQKKLLKDITSGNLSSEEPGKSECSDFSNVAMVTDEDPREVVRILGDEETYLLMRHLDLMTTLQENCSGEEDNHETPATNNSIGTIGNQDNEVSHES
ncbi:hypothetical protein phytr_9110 [Candidatus Phycorickettsia trachydisci]|uniref:Uncharacterized protein n=1 Tax=Candidatus Phycorickettsia trachydisci TaxID=2115978 RepID=A0A2P1P9A3_9RICK|nr:hypothetical protein [Candidatus Phycorickettsia trachydisci]AVP87840.1 hypothetical protein phytr_9110 [Candidatus Phycorickettsia trachydisci]